MDTYVFVFISQYPNDMCKLDRNQNYQTENIVILGKAIRAYSIKSVLF